jgi:hypothetical protein
VVFHRINNRRHRCFQLRCRRTAAAAPPPPPPLLLLLLQQPQAAALDLSLFGPYHRAKVKT